MFFSGILEGEKKGPHVIKDYSFSQQDSKESSAVSSSSSTSTKTSDAKSYQKAKVKFTIRNLGPNPNIPGFGASASKQTATGMPFNLFFYF